MNRWSEVRAERTEPSDETKVSVERGLALGQLIFDLRTENGLDQHELADRASTTQPVISALEEGGGVCGRIDTLGRVATALGRHLFLSFPEMIPEDVKDSVQIV